MSKYSAFGSVLNMGIQQVETAIVVGTIVNPGNATFTLTKNGMTGSPIATSVAVLSGDTPTVVATKAAAAMNLNANITAKCKVEANGDRVVVTALSAVADDGTFNLAYTNGTCTGLTADATSDNTTAGVAMTAIANIASIGGPSLEANTEDVTTHDSAGGWEEVVVTTLASGEVSLDLVYDPNAATHAATSGLLAKLQNKTYAQYAIVFPSNPTCTWTFNAWASGFETDAPVDGSLTASGTLKITGSPTLA